MSSGRPKQTLLVMRKSASFEWGEAKISVGGPKKTLLWGEVSNADDRAMLEARIVDGVKNYDIYFMTADLDDLMRLKWFGKRYREDVPSKGERSVLQKPIKNHIGCWEKESNKPEHEDRALVLEHGLNVSGC
eukprot:1693539-Rhodomonas_salina.1